MELVGCRYAASCHANQDNAVFTIGGIPREVPRPLPRSVRAVVVHRADGFSVEGIAGIYGGNLNINGAWSLPARIERRIGSLDWDVTILEIISKDLTPSKLGINPKEFLIINGVKSDPPLISVPTVDTAIVAENANTRDHWVYLIGWTKGEAKIGISSDLIERLKTHNRNYKRHVLELSVVGQFTYQDARAVERKFKENNSEHLAEIGNDTEFFSFTHEEYFAAGHYMYALPYIHKGVVHRRWVAKEKGTLLDLIPEVTQLINA